MNAFLNEVKNLTGLLATVILLMIVGLFLFAFSTLAGLVISTVLGLEVIAPAIILVCFSAILVLGSKVGKRNDRRSTSS